MRLVTADASVRRLTLDVIDDRLVLDNDQGHARFAPLCSLSEAEICSPNKIVSWRWAGRGSSQPLRA